MGQMQSDVINMNWLEFTEWVQSAFLEGMNQVQVCNYFNQLQRTVDDINHMLKVNSLAASTGQVSRNPQLHGFLFEKVHAYTFNARAMAAGKDFRVFVLPVDGGGFAKNSVDLAIYRIDEFGRKTGHPIRQYQAKCCYDANATVNAFLNGDYRNQRLLVPNGQVNDVKACCSSSKSVIDKIEYDGISSSPQKYSQMKEMQNAMLSGNFDNIDFSMWTNKELATMALLSVKDTILVDTLIRFAFIALDHVALKTDHSLKEDILNNVVDIGWDTVRNAFAETAMIAIAKGYDYIPESLKNIPSELLNPVVFEVCGLLVDTCRVSYGYQTGKYTEVDVYVKIIQSVIKSACTLVASGVAGAVSEGTLAVPVGSVAGRLLGEFIVNKVGNENFEIIAQGILDLKNNVNALVVNNDIKIKDLFIEKQLAMEGV